MSFVQLSREGTDEGEAVHLMAASFNEILCRRVDIERAEQYSDATIL